MVDLVWDAASVSVLQARQRHRERVRAKRRAVSGATGALRRAALELSAGGVVVMTTRELVATVAAQGEVFSRETLRIALIDEVAGEDGAFARVRPGLLRLRDTTAPADRQGSAAVAHVLSGPADHDTTTTGITRAQLHAHLLQSGVQYSNRTVRDALTRLTRDPASGVTRDRGHRYRMQTPPRHAEPAAACPD